MRTNTIWGSFSRQKKIVRLQSRLHNECAYCLDEGGRSERVPLAVFGLPDVDTLELDVAILGLRSFTAPPYDR